MDNKSKILVNTCDFTNVRPIMLDLPYPSVQVREKTRGMPIF